MICNFNKIIYEYNASPKLLKEFTPGVYTTFSAITFNTLLNNMKCSAPCLFSHLEINKWGWKCMHACIQHIVIIFKKTAPQSLFDLSGLSHSFFMMDEEERTPDQSISKNLSLGVIVHSSSYWFRCHAATLQLEAQTFHLGCAVIHRHWLEGGKSAALMEAIFLHMTELSKIQKYSH